MPESITKEYLDSIRLECAKRHIGEHICLDLYCEGCNAYHGTGYYNDCEWSDQEDRIPCESDWNSSYYEGEDL